MAYRKLLQQVTRRGNPPDIVTALLEIDARDKSFFEQREKLDVIAQRMTTPVRTVTVSRDDEHNVFALAIEDRSQGYPRIYGIGLEFITSGEYRTLLNAYREIQDIKFPVVVKASDVRRRRSGPGRHAGRRSGRHGDRRRAARRRDEARSRGQAGAARPQGSGHDAGRHRRVRRVLHHGRQEGRRRQPLQGSG